MLKHEQYLIALGNNILLYFNTCQFLLKKNILAETRTQNPQIRSLVRFHCATKI